MTVLVVQIIFWLSVAELFYTYIGYPLVVYLFGVIRPLKVNRADFQPTVTILITAYNEERDIGAKLENTLQIDYPKGKIEILVASDGSTDKTDEIVRGFAGQGVKFFRQEGRVGKTFTQNKAVEQAAGEIVLFSDATTMYRPDVLSEIMPNFADQTIGCVAGKLIYVDPSGTSIGTGAKSYWNYETFLKERESLACSLIGASGCLYAVRRAAYKPMYPEACSDFLIATVMYEQGLRTIYEPNAICTEETNHRTDKEMRMRVRVISQTFTDLWRNRRMLNPFKSGFYALELISHKIFRYMVPVFLIIILLTTAFLAFHSPFFTIVFLLQVGFYLTGLFAWLFEKTGIFAIPLYFMLTNLASLIGFYKFLSGERYARWEPIRDTKDNNSKSEIFHRTT